MVLCIFKIKESERKTPIFNIYPVFEIVWQVLTDLQNRGLEDVFIACIDNLQGFADAIESVLPKTEVQLCIVH